MLPKPHAGQGKWQLNVACGNCTSNLTRWGEATHVQHFNLCNLWRTHWLAMANACLSISLWYCPSPPPIALLDRNLWAQHVQKAEQSFSRRAWFVVTKVFHRFSLATHTHTLFSTEFSGGNPFNVAVKTSEEKLFRIVWTIKKQHKIIKKKNSLWKKKTKTVASTVAGRGRGAQPISLYVC